MTFQTEFGEFGNNFYELYARGKFWFFIVFASIFVGSPIKWVQHRTRTQQIIAHILFKYFLFYCIVRVLCIHMYMYVHRRVYPVFESLKIPFLSNLISLPSL